MMYMFVCVNVCFLCRVKMKTRSEDQIPSGGFTEVCELPLPDLCHREEQCPIFTAELFLQLHKILIYYEFRFCIPVPYI